MRSKEHEIEEEILSTLMDQFPKGVGYNKLFHQLHEKQNIAGSRSTFEKYLKKLEKEGYIQRKPNPKHKKGKLIYYISSDKADKLISWLNAVNRFVNISERLSVKPVEVLLNNKKVKLESSIEFERLANAILILHDAFSKLYSGPQVFQKALFIKSELSNGKVKLHLRTDDQAD